MPYMHKLGVLKVGIRAGNSSFVSCTIYQFCLSFSVLVMVDSSNSRSVTFSVLVVGRMYRQDM